MRDRRLKRLLLAYRERRSGKDAARLFDLLADDLLAVARRIARDEGEAEDLVQATFLTLLESPERFDEAGEVRPWLMGILTREARYWHRRDARRPDPERLGFERQSGTLTPPTALDPASLADEQEARSLVDQALARLPLLYREVLSAHLQQGQAPGEIASRVNRSPATVRVQLHRGLAQLRQLLPVGLSAGMAIVLAPRGATAMRGELLQMLAPKAAAPAVSTGTEKTLMEVLAGGGKWILGGFAIGVLAFFSLPDGENLLSTSGLAVQESSSDVREIPLPTIPPEAGGNREVAILPGDSRQANPITDRTSTTQDTFPLTVEVIWSDGTPAANVMITVSPGSSGMRMERRPTNERGRVQFDNLPRGKCHVEVDRGAVATPTLGSMAGGLSPRANQGELPKAKLVRMMIPPGFDIEGRAVDSYGQPVEGAEVWVSKAPFLGSTAGAAVTGTNGRFSLRSLSYEFCFGVRHDRYAPSKAAWVRWLQGGQPAGARTFEIELELPGPSAQVTGRVVDPGGLPLNAARVSLGPQSGFEFRGGLESESQRPPQEFVTDAHGRFDARGLTPGEIRVAVKAEGYPVWVGSLDVDAHVAGHLNIRLEQASWIEGTVRDETGKPLDDAWVRACNPVLAGGGTSASSFRPVFSRADGHGEFRLGPLHSGELKLIAVGRGRTAEHVLVTSPGQTHSLDLVLGLGPFIAGSARTAAGEPLAFWRVSAIDMEGTGLEPTETVCIENGWFYLPISSTQGTYQVQLRPFDREFPCAPVTWVDDVASGTTDLDLRVNPAQDPQGSLRATVHTRSGNPTPEITLILTHESFGKVTEKRIPAGKSQLLIEHLPEGALTLRLLANDYERLTVDVLHLGPGEARTLAPLVMCERDSGGDDGK